MNEWDQHRQSPASRRRPDHPYVLVVDTDSKRIDACLECIETFDVGVRVAPDGEQAVNVLKQVGPPALLLADLSLRQAGGFSVIEALRLIDRESAHIIAWAPSRDIREFAAQRLAGLNVHVLGGAVAVSVLRSAIRRALQTNASPAAPGASPHAPLDEVDQTLRTLSDRARQLCGAPGVAVYLKAPRETAFRSAITWTSDAPIPSVVGLPQALNSVVDNGATLVVPDPAARSLSNRIDFASQNSMRGMVAVPIVAADYEMLGMICVFDLKPLSLPSTVIEALEALGRPVALPPAMTPVPRTAVFAQRSDRPAAVSRATRSTESLSPKWRPVVLDRQTGDVAIARELVRARREQRHLSVVLFAIDRLISDTGPRSELAIDPLATMSDRLATAIRGYDLAVRWDREALLVVLPGLSAVDARHVAERVRAVVKAGSSHSVAVSGGVAELQAEDTFESVVARAIQKVELARERGHNRVA
jgi:GGDEF domain-containing protein/CheY-like chemotaxis protein